MTKDKRGPQFAGYPLGTISEEYCPDCNSICDVSLDEVPTKCPHCGVPLVQCNACLMDMNADPCHTCKYNGRE